jgi:hypothetical protein
MNMESYMAMRVLCLVAFAYADTMHNLAQAAAARVSSSADRVRLPASTDTVSEGDRVDVTAQRATSARGMFEATNKMLRVCCWEGWRTSRGWVRFNDGETHTHPAAHVQVACGGRGDVNRV